MNDSTDAKAQASLTRLLDIMRRLRDPASGCPWDREQNFASTIGKRLTSKIIYRGSAPSQGPSASFRPA